MSPGLVVSVIITVFTAYFVLAHMTQQIVRVRWRADREMAWMVGAFWFLSPLFILMARYEEWADRRSYLRLREEALRAALERDRRYPVNYRYEKIALDGRGFGQ